MVRGKDYRQGESRDKHQDDKLPPEFSLSNETLLRQLKDEDKKEDEEENDLGGPKDLLEASSSKSSIQQPQSTKAS